MAEKAKETMSLSHFARKHCVNRKTATRWRQEGYIVPSVGPVDVVRSEARLAERPAQSGGGFAKGPHANDDAPAGALTAAKQIKETFIALLAEHKAKKLADSIVATDAAVQAVAEDMAEIAARFRQVPALAAPRLVKVNAAPEASAIIYRDVCAALSEISGVPHGVESLYLPPGEEASVPAEQCALYYRDMDGVAHYIRKSRDEIVEEQKPKKKRRHRSTREIEAAIAETGSEDDVDQDLIVRVERAIDVMSLSQARLRREVAEGRLQESKYALLKHQVVPIDSITAAITKNANGIRANMLALASKVAPTVALLTDAKDIERAISKEIEQVLFDMVDPRKSVEDCFQND